MFARSTILSAAVAAVLAAGSTASAALLAYEGFDGSPTGFAATKQFPAAGGANGTAVASSLSYGDLTTSGGARQGGESWSLKSTLSTSVSTGTVWVSWLFNSDKNGWNRMVTFNGVESYGADERYNLGFVGDGFALRGVWSGTLTQTHESIAPGSTYMLVAKYDFGTAGADDGSITLWVNPNTTSLGTGAEPTGGTKLTQSGITSAFKSSHMAFTGIAFHGIDAGAVTLNDELRVGQTWIDVSPVAVPEPAALGLIAASAVLGLRRRSR